MYGSSGKMEEELHKGRLLICFFESVMKQYGCVPGTPENSCSSCLYSLLTVYGIRRQMDQELQRGLLHIFLIVSVWSHGGSGRRAPQATSAYIPYCKCMESLRKWIKSSTRASAHSPYYKCMGWLRKWTEDFCLDFLLEVYGPSQERDQALHS